MNRIIKRIVAITLVVIMVTMCGGCGSISYSEEEYERYLEEPQAYMDEEYGEDSAWGDFWASPIGRLGMAALVAVAKNQKTSESIPSQEQVPEEDVVNMLTYNAHGYGDILFQDYDWEYQSQEQNWYTKGRDYIAHGLARAKSKYKDAFRTYIKEFIVENEYRYATEISFEEEKASLLSFLESTKEIISDELEMATTTGSIVSVKEYEGLIKTIQEAKQFDKKIDKTFEDLIERTIKFAQERDIKLLVNVKAPETLKGAFKMAGDIADAVILVFDIADCVKTRTDVLKTQKLASEFFELTELFKTISENTTNSYMRKAANELLTEIKGGQFKDLDDLIERKLVQTVISINPLVSITGGLIDTVMMEVHPVLKELDTAYVTDAIRHIKVASCELLRENTEYTEGDICYYKEENKEKVDVYLRHCLYAQLVWTYTINEGKKESSIVLDYFKLSGIEQPEAVQNYVGGGGHSF